MGGGLDCRRLLCHAWSCRAAEVCAWSHAGNFTALAHSGILDPPGTVGSAQSMSEPQVRALARGFSLDCEGRVSHKEFLRAVWDMLESGGSGYSELAEKYDSSVSSRVEADGKGESGAVAAASR